MNWLKMMICSIKNLDEDVESGATLIDIALKQWLSTWEERAK